ncbi:MAG TPA: lysylphosphatidylglycerol synthase transmembrane domain-containing protein [Micromonosporaceae bacterium]
MDGEAPARTTSTVRRLWPWLRVAAGVAILAIVVWRVGTGPFLAGFRVVGTTAVLAAMLVGLLTTLSSAWRWRRVAAGLGVQLGLRDSVAAYYRSQFLNATLPGGVVGDAHRAVRHGRDIGDVRLALRAVVLERSASLATQASVAAAALLLLPSPLRMSRLPVAVAVAGVATATVVAGIAVTAARPLRAAGGLASALRAGAAEIREGVFARGTWLVVVLSSATVLAGNLTVFVIAARAAGSRAPLELLAALTLLALLAMALPLSLAGWGPREGVAAWAFATAGLGATVGVTTAVAYGTLTLISCLPGAGVLAAGAREPRGGRSVAERVHE